MPNEIIDRPTARRKWGEAYGSWYWANRHKGHPEYFSGNHTKTERVAMILEYRKWREIWKAAPSETDEHGNTIYRDEDVERFLKIRRPEERYYYDFEACKPADGWKQYDTSQDAWYFGVWVHLEKRMILTYAEGDRTLVVCPDNDRLRGQLAHMAEFYGPPPPAFIVFDVDAKTRTEIFDTRPEVA